MVEVGIVETRNIIKAITDQYGFDFSDYALTSFKQRLERIIQLHNIKYVDILIEKIVNDRQFFETILSELEVSSTEMFRDPSIWRLLRDDLIPSLIKETGSSFKIWLPNSVSGDELFSLCILLREMDMLDRMQIVVSVLSDKSIETIRSGILQSHKLEISTDNYKRANGKSDLSDYYTVVNNEAIRDRTLIQNVTFYRQDLYLAPIPKGVKLILYRNKMIYFNQTLQTRILKAFYQHLSTGSYLIIGTKESLNTFYGMHEFALANSSESIYKRK